MPTAGALPLPTWLEPVVSALNVLVSCGVICWLFRKHGSNAELIQAQMAQQQQQRSALSEPFLGRKSRPTPAMATSTVRALIGIPWQTFDAFAQRLHEPKLMRGYRLMVLALGATIFAMFFLSPSTTSILVGCLMTLCFSLFILILTKSQQESQWLAIAGFQNHRHIRYNKDNVIALVSLVLVLGQLCAVGFKVLKQPDRHDTSSYDTGKVRVEHFFQAFLFDIRPVFDEVELAVGEYRSEIDFAKHYLPAILAASCVMLCLARYGPLALAVLKHAHQDGQDQVADRMAIYCAAKDKPGFKFGLALLTDTLCISIMVNLELMLSCIRDDANNMWLAVDPTVPCFEGWHMIVAPVVIALMILYSMISIVLVPFIVADSDGEMESEQLDIKYPAFFLAQDRLAKIAMALVSIYFRHYPIIPRNFNFTVAVWMAYTTSTLAPCSIPWINMVRKLTYQLASCLFFGIMLDANVTAGWLPAIVMCASVVFFTLRAGFMLRGALHVPTFTHGELMGEKYGDSVPWSDVSLLRGKTHKISRVLLWNNTGSGDAAGIQVHYEVDGVEIHGPIHISSWGDKKGIDVDYADFRSTELEKDEWLTTAGCPSGGKDCRSTFWLGTSKGREILGKPMSQGGSPTLTAPPGTVVGLHGSRNGNPHQLGFILQED